MNPVQTPNAPTPAGHYSQGVIHGGLVYVSGQLPIEAVTGRHVNGPIEEQMEQALRNLDAILTASGSSRDRVLRATVYVSDVVLWPKVNAVCARFFGDHRPARTVVPTAPLHYGFLVEIDAVAALETAPLNPPQPG